MHKTAADKAAILPNSALSRVNWREPLLAERLQHRTDYHHGPAKLRLFTNQPPWFCGRMLARDRRG
jgi:hypothetical protein